MLRSISLKPGRPVPASTLVHGAWMMAPILTGGAAAGLQGLASIVSPWREEIRPIILAMRWRQKRCRTSHYQSVDRTRWLPCRIYSAQISTAENWHVSDVGGSWPATGVTARRSVRSLVHGTPVKRKLSLMCVMSR
ncbi:hypothetical protein LX32DRAFT_713560 [Colletotrichum zoysiae]|uniref:Uncharacterized protein n=1 Tax=Colletotrichum zoysiae TaxID=1216348 RepID=A0AAD9LWX6_9PEZI|nr:hypothetical protein LX32DRAFT_713560 [Colletotrichum zoysiae]